MSEDANEEMTLDTTDVDRWIGVPLGGGRMKDSVGVNDVRRWVQSVQNPNPLYYDDEYAAESRFGGIVAPLSFAVSADTSGRSCSASPPPGTSVHHITLSPSGPLSMPADQALNITAIAYDSAGTELNVPIA